MTRRPQRVSHASRYFLISPLVPACNGRGNGVTGNQASAVIDSDSSMTLGRGVVAAG